MDEPEAYAAAEDEAKAAAKAERDALLEPYQRQHGKCGHVEWEGHLMVFRPPSRFEIREYRRKQDTAEKPDALDQLAQCMIVYFDGETDPVRVRRAFNDFLDAHGLFMSSVKSTLVFNALTGLVENDEALAMGKGWSVRGPLRFSSLTGSPNGSATAPVASAPSHTTRGQPASFSRKPFSATGTG